jgi:Tfp pilus assembly protein PilF
MADSAFADFSRMQPKSPDGYLWRAKSKLELEDKKSLKGLSVAHYTKYVELIEADAASNGQQVLVKHKTNLINAYSYLAFVALTNKDNATAKEQFRKILVIEPDNKIANEEIKKL